MYITAVPNRTSPPAILLRESYRQGGKVKNRTLANLSRWPKELVEGLRTLLKGGKVVETGETFEISRSLPHGHVAAILGTMRRIGLDKLLDRTPSRMRSLVLGLVASRVLEPVSKLATVRRLSSESATSTLSKCLDIEDVAQEEVYDALDWLVARQDKIEARLAKKHLYNGTLVLYDVTSVWLEGRCCPLGRFGYRRGGKKGKLQIVFGLLCDFDGFPIAVEVFEGNTSDPKTLKVQIDKIRQRFHLSRVVLVGDRGLITSARIEEELRGVDGLEWITCLRAEQIRGLVAPAGLQLSLFDERDLAEISHPDFPNERLIACRNPLLAEERRRKRLALLSATEKNLGEIRAATLREKRPLRGKDKIGIRLGKVLARSKVGKHFILEIEDQSFTFRRDQAKIDAEASLDGVYVIRTSLPFEEMPAEDAVEVYKGLSVVERAFRRMKTVDLKVRPVFHWTATRVRAHVFLTMLAYYVEWHMRKSLAPLLFEDDDPVGARDRRESIVAPAQRSPSAINKEQIKRTEDGLPVHNFRGLLDQLGTLTKNWLRITPELPEIERTSLPNPLQKRAFELLDLDPSKL